MMKILFLEQDHLLASCIIEREKFYSGPGFEPGSLTLSIRALTTELSRTSTDPR